MTCQTNQAAPLPCCAKSIKLGKIAEAKTGIYVFLQNLTTEKKIYRQLNTESDGTVIIDTSDINFPTDQPFEIYLREGITYATRLKFTVGSSDELEFIRTRFEPITNFDNESAEILQAEVSMAE